MALCTKCARKTPGTKEGFEFEGLLLLSQLVADVWGERAMQLHLTCEVVLFKSDKREDAQA